MAGLTSIRLRWLRATGSLPSVEKLEARRAAFEALYARYSGYRSGGEYARYCELVAYIDTGEPERVRGECAQAVYRGSAEEALLQEYKQLRRKRAVRRARRGKGDLQNPDFLRYQELLARVESPEFQDRVAYLKDKKKFEKTDAAHALEEYAAISRSQELKWYLQQHKREVFSDRDRSQEVFFDDFDAGQLDRSKWSTRFYWGEALLGKPYSFMGDPHCYTDGKNLSMSDGCLVIETRPERAEALAWDTQLGFMPKVFSYTSGVVTTGKDFRMGRGLFEAKVRFDSVPGVYHAFYLCGATMLPQVNVFRSRDDRAGCVAGSLVLSRDAAPDAALVGALPFDKEFFILSVEWDGSKLVWSINGYPYKEEEVQLPDEPLYLVLLSGVVPGAAPEAPARLEVDWVRCVSKREA